MTIRVLHLAGTSILGGAEMNLLRVMKHGHQVGVEPVAVLVPEEGPLVHRVAEMGIPAGVIQYYGFRLPNPFRHFQTLWQLYAWVRKSQPHVIHLNLQPFAEFACRLKQLTRLPVICDVRGIHNRENFIPGYRRWLPGLDQVIVPSYAVQRDLEQWGVATHNVLVNYDGIDVQEFAATSSSRVLRRELGLSDDHPLIGIVGRVAREKGIEEFIRAAHMVAQERPQARFLVVGSDNAEGRVLEAYQALAGQLQISDRLFFTGFRSDVADVLHDLDVFVLASWMEACPNSVLEAMAAGTLVVATNVGGVPEMITDGETGLLVPPRDPAALAQGILTALSLPADRRASITQAARQRVGEVFSIERQVRSLAELYTTLLSRSRPVGLSHRSPGDVWMRDFSYRRHSEYGLAYARLKKLDWVVRSIRRASGSNSGNYVILDAGCGTGNVSLPLASLGYSVTGFDRCTASIASARHRCTFPNLHLVVSNLETPGIKGQFDAILLLDVLEHVSDGTNVLRRLVGLLKPGGVLLLSVPNGYGPWQRYTDWEERVLASSRLRRFLQRTKQVAKAIVRALPGRRFKFQTAGPQTHQRCDPIFGGPDAIDSGPHLHRYTVSDIEALVADSGLKVVERAHSDWVSCIGLVGRLFRHHPALYRLDQRLADCLPASWVSGWYFLCVKPSHSRGASMHD